MRINFKIVTRTMLVLATSVLLTACGPPRVDKFVEVEPNETAFVVPLEGSTKDQKKILSVDYLNDLKIATKRIFLPLRKIKTGRWWFSYTWVPTIRVITVNRKPIRLVWESNDISKNGIKVESRDSIGFTVGIDITAHISEVDTALFLYNYPSGDLANILGAAVKSKSTEILSREFAKYDLEGTKAIINRQGKVTKEATKGAREEKGAIVEIAKSELIEHFAQQGVTIDTFGLIGGLWYEDQAIQESINENFRTALDIENKSNERKGQEEVNKRKLSIATNDKLEAQEFEKAAQARTAQVELEIKKMEAEANLEKARRWDGKLPLNIMPEGSGFILGMN